MRLAMLHRWVALRIREDLAGLSGYKRVVLENPGHIKIGALIAREALSTALVVGPPI